MLEPDKDKPHAVNVPGYGYVDVRAVRAIEEALAQQTPREGADALVKVQFQEYPDSRILHRSAPLDWISEDSRVTKDDVKAARERWSYLLGPSVDTTIKSWVDDQLCDLDAQVRALQRALSTARSALCATLNALDEVGSPAPVFYECGLKPDGTYKWRGARYGIEPHQYMSGFSKL